MRKIFTLVFLVSTICVKAQQKIPVAFIPITFEEEKVSATEAKIIQETVLNTFVASKRFTVVDREKLEELAKEKKLQRSEAFMDSDESSKDGVSKGASVLIATNVVSIRNSNVKNGWESAIHLQIKILDVSTGEILATENISSEFSPIDQTIKDARKMYLSKDDIKAIDLRETHLNEIKGHKEDAFMIGLQRLGENVKKFTRFNFPMALNILEWSKKEFVLGGGYKFGIYKGQILDVVLITDTTIGDKKIERKQKVGSAWVFKVDDDNFSVATIINESKEYKAAKKTGGKLGVLTR